MTQEQVLRVHGPPFKRGDVVIWRSNPDSPVCIVLENRGWDDDYNEWEYVILRGLKKQRWFGSSMKHF